jgi:biotin carboxylase
LTAHSSRVLVLGGGSSQLGLLAACRARRLFVVLADRDPEAPGRKFADAFDAASTFDLDAIRRTAVQRGVDAVITAGTDQPVLVAARVASELGLPSFLDVDTARSVTNKRYMKERFASLGIPCARWRIVGRDGAGGHNSVPGSADGSAGLSLGELSGPFVTKPLDSQGQRGVYKLDDITAIRRVADDVLSYSRETEFLVEEYYAGPEVTVSGWVSRGEPTIFSVTDRVTVESPPHIGVCFAHRYPTHLGSLLPEILSLSRRIVEGFRIQEGPIYFQFLCGDRGVIVNEISCRLGGAYEDLFIPRITGIDPVDLLIRGSLGERVVPAPAPGFDHTAAARYVSIPLLFCRPGTIAVLSDLAAVRALPGVVAAQWLQKQGTVIRPMSNSTQRVAYLIVEAFDRATMNDRVEAALAALSVTDGTGRELLLDARRYAWHPAPV